MSTFHFDREKYIEIMKSEGVPAALTQLQKDTVTWEVEAFEGSKGYQPEMWKSLIDVRTFSRELWQLSLDQEKI